MSAGTVYQYRRLDGAVAYEVVRGVDQAGEKTFTQRVPSNNGAGPTYKLDGVERFPYRLPELASAASEGAIAWVVEGEKDAERLAGLGLVATTNPGGAGKYWTPAWAEHFRGLERVYVIPDNDDPGRKHAELVAGVVATAVDDVRIVTLHGIDHKGDVSDWLDLGNDVGTLWKLAEAAPTWKRPIKAPSNGPHDGQDGDSSREVIVMAASAVRQERTRWLWASRIPLGGVTLLAGQEGSGKTTLAIEVAARASRGQLSGDLDGQPISVVYATAEDSWSRTLAPRLEAAGADLARVFFVTVDGLAGGLVLPGDLDAVVAEMRRVGALMLVLDPLGAHLHSTLDTHRDASVRQALAPLANRMDEVGGAAVGIMHWSKAPTTVALDRVNGSRGFTAAARCVLATGNDPADDSCRVVVVAKSNLGRLDVAGLRYRIEGREVPASDGGGPIKTSGLTWCGETPGLTANDLLASASPGDDENDAASVLTEILSHGPVWVNQAFASMAEAGFSKDQAKRAKQKLRTLSVKVGKPGDSEQGWQWALPRREHEGSEGSEECVSQKTAPFAPFGAPFASEEVAVTALDDQKGIEP